MHIKKKKKELMLCPQMNECEKTTCENVHILTQLIT